MRKRRQIFKYNLVGSHDNKVGGSTAGPTMGSIILKIYVEIFIIKYAAGNIYYTFSFTGIWNDRGRASLGYVFGIC